MTMADLDEVANLLHVHEKASAHGDLLRNIANTAMAKLKQINEEHGRPQEVVEDQTEPEPTTEEPEEEEHEDNG
jgi:hypothetical protein